MKRLTIVLALCLAAQAQDSTSKITVPDGTTLTVGCHWDPVNKSASCKVADTTVQDALSDLKELHKLNKASAQWCKDNGLKKNTEPCRAAWLARQSK